MQAPRHNHGRGRDGVGALVRLGLLRVGHVGRVGAAGIVARPRAAHWVVLRAPKHGTAVSPAPVLARAAGRAVGQLLAVLLGHRHLAVVADIWVRVERGARPPAAVAAVGRGKAGEVGVVRGGARARGRRLEGRGELGQSRAQLQRRGLVVEALVGVGGQGVFGWRRHARVAGAARRGRGLGADDGRRTVDLAEVSERDLRARGSAMPGGGCGGS